MQPLLHIDLYEARLFIRGRRNQILAHALASAKRIAKEHGITALRHEANQRQALRQGFMRAYLQVNPIPIERGKEVADRYRRELLAVTVRAEAELMAMLATFKGMLMRLALKGVTSGLSESDGEADHAFRRLPRFNRTAIAHRANASKRRYTTSRAAQAAHRRPGQAEVLSALARMPSFPSSFGPRQSVTGQLRSLLLTRWMQVEPLANGIATALARSSTGDPGPILFGHITADIMIRRGAISRESRQDWAKCMAALWSSPVPKSVSIAIAAAFILLGQMRRQGEAEALAAFEMAAS